MLNSEPADLMDKNKDYNKINECDASTKLYSIYSYCYLFFAIMNYSMMSLFRNSVSAITDALQSSFDTTSSGIGLLSSLFYASYLFCQLPSGMMLEKLLDNYLLSILFITTCGILISCLSFGLNLINSFILAIIIRVIGGIFGAPDWVTGIALSAKYFGNNNYRYYHINNILNFRFIW